MNQVSISSLNEEREIRVAKAMDDCGVFFAFSNEQFEENKKPLREGDTKYRAILGGGLISSSMYIPFLKALEEIDTWYETSLIANGLRREKIAYELANHEAYYTGDIKDTLEALGNGYTYKEVVDVYNVERKKHCND